MARVFLRLKLALLANGFRRGWQQALGIVVGLLYALPLALLASRGMALVGRRAPLETVAEPVLVVGSAVLWVGWVVGPLLAFGMDETLDPGRLRLLPLTRRELMGGLLAASALGVAPLATLVVLYGVVIGFVPLGAGAPVVVVAAVVQFLLCITAARAATTALSRTLASRRGRDVLTVAAALFGLLAAGLAQLPRLVMADVGPTSPQQVVAGLERAAAAASILPGAWPARAIGAAARGELVAAVAWLAAAAGIVVLLLWWWAASLDRMLDRGAVATAGHRDTDLYPALLRWLPRSRLWGNVAKDLRYAWRVPQLRVQYLIVALLVVPTAAFTIGSERQPFVVLLSAVPLLLLGTTGFNVFGADRGAVWLLDATGPRPGVDLAAKSIVSAGLALPIVGVIAVILAALTSGWEHLPAALLIAVGVQGIVSGVGLVVSVQAPFALPDSPTNVFAANAGAGCAAILLQGLGLVVEVALIAPIVMAVAFSLVQDGRVAIAIGVAAALWGAALWLGGLAVARKRMTRHGPEFVAALQPRAG